MALSVTDPVRSLEYYEKYGRAGHLLPEVPSVGFGIYYQAAIGGPRPHASGIVYEICYINRGSVEWWIDNRLYEVGPGNVFINKPGEWHGGSNAMFHPCEIYWVQIEFLTNGSLPTLTLQATDRLQHDLASMEARFFAVSPGLKTHYDDLLNEYRQIQVYSTVAARAALHQILVSTIRDHARQETTTRSPGIVEAMHWIERHLTENYPIEDVARIANMSEGYFYKRFLEEVGYTPGEYRMRRRMHLAKYLLRDGQIAITDIAFMLGFSTSQYFATVFRKLVGLTPRDYRQIVTGQKQVES
jgi:AraC-like DNA-binding protein